MSTWRNLAADLPDLAEAAVARCEACGKFKPCGEIIYLHVLLKKPKREHWRYRCVECGEGKESVL